MRVDSLKESFATSRDVNVHAKEVIGKFDEQQNDSVKVGSPSIGDKYFNEMIEKTNKKLASENTHLRLSIHDLSHQIVVKVVNTETDEVIREIPPEKFIDLVYNLCKQVGLVLDERG